MVPEIPLKIGNCKNNMAASLLTTYVPKLVCIYQIFNYFRVPQPLVDNGYLARRKKRQEDTLG